MGSLYRDMVSPHVFLQRHGLGVALTADLADKGTFSRVKSTVNYKGGGLGETLPTVLTFVGLLSWRGASLAG